MCFIQVGKNPNTLKGIREITKILSMVRLKKAEKAGIKSMTTGVSKQCTMHNPDKKTDTLEKDNLEAVVNGIGGKFQKVEVRSV